MYFMNQRQTIEWKESVLKLVYGCLSVIVMLVIFQSDFPGRTTNKYCGMYVVSLSYLLTSCVHRIGTIHCDKTDGDKTVAAVVQWNCLRSGGLGIPEHIGSNTDYGLSRNWASTRVNSPLVGGLSDRRPPLVGLL